METNEHNTKEELNKENVVTDETPQEEVTEEKVLEDLEGYMKDFTDYESIEDVPFEELIDFIG